MIFPMRIFRDVLDRLLTAPGETPSQALTHRGKSSPSARQASVDSPKTQRPTTRESKPKPATVYLLLDVSGSMDEGKLRQARDGGLSFAEDAIRKGYQVGAIQFSTWARIASKPTTKLGGIRTGLEDRALQLTTNMAAAIELATGELKRLQGLRSIVLVTDGYPDSAEAALAAARDAKKHDITIIAIGTDDADRHFLKKLASAAELATTVPSVELKVAIASAAQHLLPARRM